MRDKGTTLCQHLDVVTTGSIGHEIKTASCLDCGAPVLLPSGKGHDWTK
jgi:hypothetical protein